MWGYSGCLRLFPLKSLLSVYGLETSGAGIPCVRRVWVCNFSKGIRGDMSFISIRSGFRTLAIAAAFLVLGTATAWPQATSTATVTGQVTDQQGAAIAGAEVQLLD